MAAKIPEKFLDHIRPFLGGNGAVEEFIETAQRPLPITLRRNPKKLTQESWAQFVHEQNWTLETLPFLTEGFTLLGAKNPGTLLEHRLGFFYLQEAASMIPAEVLRRLNPKATLILDLCAAPGSKTTQIASFATENSLIVANEPSASRLQVLVANLVRLGHSNCVVAQQDGREIGKLLPEAFDSVLVDAPCSGEGTLRKDRQALRGWNRKRFRKITKTQQELLESALQSLAPGGVLVYSTCALSPEENQLAIESFLHRHPHGLLTCDLGETIPELSKSVTQDGYLWVSPHHYDTGGFFVAAFKKAGQTPHRNDLGSGGSEVSSPLFSLQQTLKQDYDFELSQCPGSLEVRDGKVILNPPGFSRVERTLRLNRRGLKIANLSEGEALLHQEFALAFGAAFRRNFLEVSRDEARHFLYGGELNPSIEKMQIGKQILLRYQGHPLGFARWENGRFRNLLGPSFVQQSVR